MLKINEVEAHHEKVRCAPDNANAPAHKVKCEEIRPDNFRDIKATRSYEPARRSNAHH